MTTKWPSSCISAVSTYSVHRYATHSIATRAALLRSYSSTASSKQHRKDKPPAKISTQKDVASGFEKAKAAPLLATGDVNPPLSTLPPALDLPTRGSEPAVQYWFRVGKAYGSFYKNGVKAVWANGKAGKQLAGRIQYKHADGGYRDFVALKYGFFAAARARYLRDAAVRGTVSRGEFQLLERQVYDIGKLPVFGLLVLLFGEWLPLLVPFIPNAVPVTCRIPKQVQGMREKAQERRQRSFRLGLEEPTREQLGVEEGEGGRSPDAKGQALASMDFDYVRSLVGRLRADQLQHLSCVLSLHGRIWDRLQLPPPAAMLRKRLTKRLNYLALDDYMLQRSEGVKKLSPPEVEIACEERGLDILGKKPDVLRGTLAYWLERQEEDGGRGSTTMAMLFRRPNAWTT